jgi:O-antigen ligase
MNRETLDKFFERGILALVLGILIFAPLAFGAVDEWAFLIVEALIVLVLIFWTLRIWLSPKPQLLWPPLCWPVLAFTIYALARYLTAPIEYVARQEMIQVLVCAILFFAIVNNLYRQEFSQAVSFTMIFLAMGIAAYAVFQFLTHSNRVWNLISPYTGRASGTFISPNNLAGFLEMLLPLAAAYVFAGRIKPVTRIFIAYAALVIAAGIAVTFSRGGWVAAAIGLFAVVAVLICHRNHRIPALALAICLIAGGACATKIFLAKTLTYIERIDSVTNGRADLDFRADMWHAAEQMWRDHFWFGVGPAHYNYRFRQYRPERVQLQPDRAHNDYLNLLADWGTTGGIIVLGGMAIFAAGLWQTRKYVQRAENHLGRTGLSNRFAFFVGATAALCALAAHSLVDFNLHIPANAILGVTLLALLTSNLRFATEKFWLNLRAPMKIFLTIIFAGGISYLSRQEIRGAQETYWIHRAQSPQLTLLDHAALLEKAFAAEPKNFQTAYDIGEAYYMQSFAGDLDYSNQAETAIQWYARAKKLNPFDGYDDLRIGMCLDWLGRYGESPKFYSRAEALDPNGYFTVANIGWHYFQTGDYAAAQEWFQRSLRLQLDENVIAESYLELTRQKLLEEASGKILPPGF